jgi:hypothetical protein
MASKNNNRRFSNLSYQDITKLDDGEFRLWQYEQTLDNEEDHRKIMKLIQETNKTTGERLNDLPYECPHREKIDRIPSIESKANEAVKEVRKEKERKKGKEITRKQFISWIVIISGISAVIASLVHSTKDIIATYLSSFVN